MIVMLAKKFAESEEYKSTFNENIDVLNYKVGLPEGANETKR